MTLSMSATDDAVRDLKRELIRREFGGLQSRSDPIIPNMPLHPDVGNFKDIAQPGGFRRDHILRSVDESHAAARKPLLETLLLADPKIARIERHLSDKSEVTGASDLATFLLICKSMLGGTVFVIPGGFLLAGLVAAPALLIFLGGIEIYCMVLLLRCSEHIGGGSYSDVAHKAFGSKGAFLVDASTCLAQLGFVCIEMLYVAHNANKGLLALGWTSAPSVKTLLILQMIVSVPMSLIRSLKYFKWSNLIANACVLSCIVALFCVAISGLAEDGLSEDVHGINSQWLIFSGTCVFSFEVINYVIPLSQEHENKKSFKPILVGTLSGIICLYITFGASFYLLFGAQTMTPITLNLSKDSALGKLVPLAIAVVAALGVPVMLFPAVVVIEGYVFEQSSAPSSHKVRKNMFRIGVVLLCTVASILGADAVSIVVSISGSFCCVPLALIYPTIFHLRLIAESRIQIFIDSAILLLGLCVFVVTTLLALSDMSNEHATS